MNRKKLHKQGIAHADTDSSWVFQQKVHFTSRRYN